VYGGEASNLLPHASIAAENEQKLAATDGPENRFPAHLAVAHNGNVSRRHVPFRNKSREWRTLYAHRIQRHRPRPGHHSATGPDRSRGIHVPPGPATSSNQQRYRMFE
jgi:hypothetical protein